MASKQLDVFGLVLNGFGTPAPIDMSGDTDRLNSVLRENARKETVVFLQENLRGGIMEQILLMEGEIKEAVKLAEWQGLNFEASKTDCERIAKAQLKKVVEWITDQCIPLDLISSANAGIALGEEAWQALLKEAGL